jgi:hypothetical protein
MNDLRRTSESADTHSNPFHQESESPMNGVRVRLAVLAACVFTTGCTFVPTPSTPLEWQTHYARELHITKGDPFRNAAPTTWGNALYFSPQGEHVSLWNKPRNATLVKLAAWVDQTKLKIEVEAESWEFLDTAALGTGHKLPLKVVDRVVGAGGWVTEKLEIRLPREFFEATRKENADIPIKLWGQRGERIVTIPASYVAAVLQASQSMAKRARQSRQQVSR